MTGQPAELAARIASIAELEEIVGAIRSVAAARLQQALAALAGTKTYAELIGAALASIVDLLPAPEIERAGSRRAPRGAILFCAEHGFVGALNTRLIDAVTGYGGVLPVLFAVGGRGVLALEERGLTAAWALPMATDIGAVTTTARRISEELYRRFGTGALAGVDILFSRYQGGGLPAIEGQTLLPVDPRRFPGPGTAAPPMTNLPPELLLDRLLEEYVFAQLAHAAMESFASENGARLATMDSASRNLEKLLTELHQSEQQARQEQITVELLDVVIGTLVPK